MLVLGRKVGEKILIDHPDGTIEVVLVEVKTKQVARIGVHAPESVRVDREEIWQAKERVKHANG